MTWLSVHPYLLKVLGCVRRSDKMVRTASRNPFLARLAAAYLVLYAFFSALLGAMFAFCFVR